MELKKENLAKATGGIDATTSYIIINDKCTLPLTSFARMRLGTARRAKLADDAVVVSSFKIKDANGKELLGLREEAMKDVVGGRREGAHVISAIRIPVILTAADGTECTFHMSDYILRAIVRDRRLANVLDRKIVAEAEESLGCDGNGGNSVVGM